MKIDLGLAVIVGASIVGLSVVVGSSKISNKPNFVEVGDFKFVNTTTGERFVATDTAGGGATFIRVPGPHDRVSKIEKMP